MFARHRSIGRAGGRRSRQRDRSLAARRDHRRDRCDQLQGRDTWHLSRAGPDLAEHSLSGRDAVKVVDVGCTGLTSARLIVLREALAPAAYDDADENLYVVAGEATLTLGDKQQELTPGWFTMVPRDTGTTLTAPAVGRDR